MVIDIDVPEDDIRISFHELLEVWRDASARITFSILEVENDWSTVCAFKEVIQGILGLQFRHLAFLFRLIIVNDDFWDRLSFTFRLFLG